MRLSVSISEQLAKTVKNVAENEKKSISSLTAEALFYYLQEKKKKKLGYKLLALAGKSKVAGDIYKLLEESRMDHHDRA
jgi:metal-responsive CopG/Arc/MetJ family transcriptional regulator